MNKIWKVEAYYSTFDGSKWITIGMFTNKEDAEETKSKWETFHINSMKIFDQPENWNPENDEWYEFNDEYGFYWEDSKEYALIHEKYGDIKDFSEIIITETKLNEDIFTETISADLPGELSSFNDPFQLLAKEFNRDWKINKVLK